jgi:NADPH2:quinone reductase
MKAIRVHQFGGPEELKLEEVPDLKPSTGQVVVRMRASGVNPVDTYMRAGTYPRKPALPFTPGTDGAGVIESAGKEATRYAPGARVYVAGSLSGTYAEQALCEEWAVFPLPEHVTFAQGAAIHSGHRRAPVRPC